MRTHNAAYMPLTMISGMLRVCVCWGASLSLCVCVCVFVHAAIVGDIRTSMLDEVDFTKESLHIQQVC